MTVASATLQELVQQVVEAARREGATAADVIAMEADAFSVQVRMGEVETTTGARDKGIGLRVFHGQRSASASTSDFSAAGIERLVADTCVLAKLTEEDPFAGLPDDPTPPSGLDLDLWDGGTRLSVDERVAMAKQAEAVAMQADPRIVNSEGGAFDTAETEVAYANSNGFAGAYRTSSYGISAMPVASEHDNMQRDYWYSSARHLADMESPEAVGAEAARRVLRRLGARKVDTCEVPVVFDPNMSASLLGHLASAVSGSAVFKGVSFLGEHLNQSIMPDGITVVDDASLARGLGSRPFDGEGMASGRLPVVENGTLTTFLLDSYSGRKLKMASTGSASRGLSGSPSPSTSNFYMLAGKHSVADIIGSVERGLLVTELIGFGVNGVTGDYSRGAAGVWIENGELSFPVEEITISGNLLEMFQNIEMVGDDLHFRSRVTAPTLKISSMTLAGN